LLSRLGLPFETMIPDIDETPQPGETPEATALRLAREKAAAIAAQRAGPGDRFGPGRHAGRPADRQTRQSRQCTKQLQLMRGREVIFHTALCLWDGRQAGGTAQVCNVQTLVRFRRAGGCRAGRLPAHRAALRLRRQRQE
jgi:septum formation protein